MLVRCASSLLRKNKNQPEVLQWGDGSEPTGDLKTRASPARIPTSRGRVGPAICTFRHNPACPFRRSGHLGPREGSELPRSHRESVATFPTSQSPGLLQLPAPRQRASCPQWGKAGGWGGGAVAGRGGSYNNLPPDGWPEDGLSGCHAVFVWRRRRNKTQRGKPQGRMCTECQAPNKTQRTAREGSASSGPCPGTAGSSGFPFLPALNESRWPGQWPGHRLSRQLLGLPVLL